jgi:UDP-4-amino-4-deoxy-L-arabinose formyltransferase/UDP-glucuronic acid dehydrogenase (UDP-4-keto-hexauronic acid decarboxylating)
MKLLLFTKKNNFYNPFIEKCQKLFPNTKIIFSDCHLKRKNKNYNKFLSDIKNFHPDVILSFYYNKLIQKEIVALSKIASLNFHGSLLPNYSGPHALNWQIINGEKVSGVTLHELTDVFDAGNILLQKRFEIHENDDANNVLKKGIACSCDVLSDFYDLLKNNKKLLYKKQILDTNIFKCVKRKPQDGQIKSHMKPTEIRNLSRALVKPWPGVYYYNISNEKILIDSVLDLSECRKILKKIKRSY